MFASRVAGEFEEGARFPWGIAPNQLIAGRVVSGAAPSWSARSATRASGQYQVASES